jgi:hypothetical protein
LSIVSAISTTACHTWSMPAMSKPVTDPH